MPVVQVTASLMGVKQYGLRCGSKQYCVDELGFLVNHHDWDDNWIIGALKAEGIPEYTGEHREVVDNLRLYYAENGSAPTKRKICYVAGVSLRRMFELFLGLGIACRVAGIPRPAK